jgi:hypothetical protein
MSEQNVPDDWKNYEDFAAGIDTNRLPPSTALTGSHLSIAFKSGQTLDLVFQENAVTWSDKDGSGTDPCDIVEVGQRTFFIDLAAATRPADALTLIVDLETRRALAIWSKILGANERPGEPRVHQIFDPGVLEDSNRAIASMEPSATRDLIGLRTHMTYSPNHVYEHTYLSSQRYCWQNLVGVQRGHGDVDMATTYKFSRNQYVFTFREFLIPVASVFFYNFETMRSTGKFLGLTADGRIQNSKAGAIIRKVSMTYYLPGQEPV